MSALKNSRIFIRQQQIITNYCQINNRFYQSNNVKNYSIQTMTFKTVYKVCLPFYYGEIKT